MSAAYVLALAPLSFVIVVLWGPTLIRGLRQLNLGKQIRLEGPSSHLAKAGTPTMGGWLFILTPLVVGLILVPDRLAIAPPLVAMLLYGGSGALDDYANMKSKEGLGFRVRYKFAWHGIIALALAWWLYQTPGLSVQRLPSGSTIDLGWLFIPFAAFVIFSCTAGVNEIDGLDGLAGGTSLIAFGSYLILALATSSMYPAAFAALVVGSLLGFLWFNVNPARVFMGDTGALALGAALAVVAFETRWALLLPVIGFGFVVELVSVILQVAYFRATHGKRLFRMSPLHHHFELIGWPEPQVVQRFWLVGFVSGAVGLVLGLW